MSVHSLALITPEQYLEAERKAEYKSEYYQGVVYAMSGASRAHSLITVNLSGELRQALKKQKCLVYSPDLRLRVTPAGLYTYPDIQVVCGEPLFADDQKDTLTNPTLIVEILSKSTEAHDRGFKFSQYRKIESLQEYFLVSQQEPRVERYLRQPGDQWLLTESAGLEGSFRSESLACSIPLAEIYDKVEFAPEAPLL
jgi:Uma2 family endonuclease